MELSFILVVSPLLFTAVPWFSIVVGLLLNKRGNDVNFLLDDLQFEDKVSHVFQLFFINKS